MYELTISDKFAAAHFLRGYDGPCQKLHGHTWRLEVTVQSNQLNSLGLVVDFNELKASLNEILKPLDHGCLNDLPAFQEMNPTTENLARSIYQDFARRNPAVRVKQVRVWESDSASVIYHEDEKA